MKNFVECSTKADDAMEPVPQQGEGGTRVPMSWSEESYRVSEVASNFTLPCVAAYDSRAYYVSRERSNIDFSQPFLFYAPREIAKVTAVSLVWEDRAGEYKPLGDPLIVPADYPGWFEVVSASCHEDDDGQLLHFRDIGSIAVSECSKFLIGGTEHVDALLIKGGNPEDTGSHLHHRLLPGDILKVGHVYEGKATKQKWIDRVRKKTITKKESFLQCRDEKEREVLIPINAAGRFYSICERGSADARGVRQISDILRGCKLPCIVRLAFGEVPSTRCLFTGTLRLESKYVQSSVLASTLFYMRNIFVEIPWEIPLKFRVADSSPDLTRSHAYQSALRMCGERIDGYKKKIKVSCLIDTPDNVVDPLDEDQEGCWEGVPHVPPKSPGVPGARESFLQSMEITGGSPTPTPPDRRKKKSLGVSPTASPATTDRRTERCKSESGVVDSDYEPIWLPRHRAESAAASISPLPHASHPPAPPGSGAPTPVPAPHLGGRTSPDGGEMAPASTGKDEYDSPPPCKPSPYIAPMASGKGALETRRSSLEPLDGGEATASKTAESSSSSKGEPLVNISVSISSRIPPRDVSLHGAMTSCKKLTSVDELSVVPPPPPAQENKPGRKRGYVNVTEASHVASVGVAVSVSARNFGTEGGQEGLPSRPPPPLAVQSAPRTHAPPPQGGHDDVGLLSAQRGHSLSRSTRQSVKVMVRDSCVYLPMELRDDKDAVSSSTWTNAPPPSLDHTPGHAPDHAPLDSHASSNPDGDVYVFADGLQALSTLKPPKPKYPEYSEGEAIYQNISDLRPLVLGEDRSPGEKAKERIMPVSASSPALHEQGGRDWDGRRPGAEPVRKTSSVTPYENVPIPHPDVPRPKSFAEGVCLDDMPPLPRKMSAMEAAPPLPPKTSGLAPARVTFELGTKVISSSRSFAGQLPRDPDAPPLPAKKKTQSFNLPPSRKPLIRSRTLGDVDDGDRDYDFPCPSPQRGKEMPGIIEHSHGSTSTQPSSVCMEPMDDDHDYEIPCSAIVPPRKKVTSFDSGDYDIPVPFNKEVTKMNSPQSEKPVTPPRVRKSRNSGQMGHLPKTPSPQKPEVAGSIDNSTSQETMETKRETTQVPGGKNQDDLQRVPEEDQPQDRPEDPKGDPTTESEPKPAVSDSNTTTTDVTAVDHKKSKTEEETVSKKNKEKTQSDQASSGTTADPKEGKEYLNVLKKKQQPSIRTRDRSSDAIETVAKAKPGGSKPAVLKKPVIAAKPHLSPKPNVRKSFGGDLDVPRGNSAMIKAVPKGAGAQKNDKNAAAVPADGNVTTKVEKPALKPAGSESTAESRLNHSEDPGVVSQTRTQNPFLPKGGLKPVSDRSRSNSFESTKTAEPTEETKKVVSSSTVEKMASKFAVEKVPENTRLSTTKKSGSVLCGRGRPAVQDEKSLRPGEVKPTETSGKESKHPATVERTEKDKPSRDSSASGSASRPLSKVRSEESDDDTGDTLTKMTSEQLLRALANVGLRQETLSVLEAEKVDGQQLRGMDAVGMRDAFPMLRNIDIKKIQMFAHGWRPKD